MLEASFHVIVSSKEKQIVVSGREYHLKLKNKTTKNWNSSKYKARKCRAAPITDGEKFFLKRGVSIIMTYLRENMMLD